MPKKENKPKWDKEAIMKRHDFNYIREHFFDQTATLDDLRADIMEVYNDNLDLTQFSAEGKNTVKVTNYFVNRTQSKATSVRAKMSPYNAIFNDDALCEIFNRIDGHPRFFNTRRDTEKRLRAEGLTEDLLTQDTSGYNELQLEAFNALKQRYIDAVNLADLREVRRAVAHMPSFHRVSQFPNHVAQRVYERYVPREGGIILDSSAGWGNRMMATLSSKFHYKYLGTDPNSEMHPNYKGIADLMYETIYKTNPECKREYPKDFIDIRDQGSEFDVPEWHQNSGYEITETENPLDFLDTEVKFKNKFTGRETILPSGLDTKYYERWNNRHPDPANGGKGCCDTGKYNTTGAKLEPIYKTHDPEVFNSGIGDISFTSPPYFFLECYTEDSFKGDLSTGQSAGKGANYKQWVKEFMYPTIVNHFNYLKPGGYYVYNLKDLPKDGLFLYSDWMSACLDVGFELIEQPEMILKSRRQFGKKDNGEDLINFNGATERLGVLRKPLHPDDVAITPESYDALYHIQHDFNYYLIKKCRPDKFESKLPQEIQDYLEKKWDGVVYKKFK